MAEGTATKGPAAPGRSGFRAALAVPAFRRLLGSYGVSRIGDFLFSTALVVVLLQQTGSATWVAALWVVRLVPYVVLPPLVGVIADRMDRRRLMIATDLGRVVVMAGLVAAVWTGGPPGLLLALAAASGVIGAPFLSAFYASLPEVLDEDALGPANALVTIVENVAVVAGPAMAAGLLLVGLDPLPFALNGLTFLASAVLLSGVRVDRPDPDGPAVGEDGKPSFLGDLAAGFAVLRSSSVVLLATLVTATVTLAYGMELVLLPLVSRDLLGTGEAGVGVLEAFAGVGGILGALVASRITRIRRVLAVFGAVAIVMVLPLALLSVIRSAPVAWALMTVEGAATALLDVMLLTTLQRLVPVSKLARVDGIVTSTLVGAMVAGSLVAPPLLSAVPLPTAMLIAAAVAATGGLVLLARSLAPLPVPAADPEVLALVRAVPAFDGLPAQAVTALAAAAVREDLAAGTVLLRQGEPADDVLLLATGTCEVSGIRADGSAEALATVRAPDLLGEIGVLHSRPRSATVTAGVDCVAWRVPGEVFRQATTGDVAPPLALSRSVETRLARWAPGQSAH